MARSSRGLRDDPNDPMPSTGCYAWEEPPPGQVAPYVDADGTVRDAEP